MAVRELIAENIKRARKIRKISRENLSSLTGISNEKLRNFESAKEFQDSYSVRKISTALNIGIDFFYESPEETESKILLKRSGLPKFEKESIFELARYKTKSVADLAIVLNLNKFRPPQNFKQEPTEEDARELGRELARNWSTDGDSLVSCMEANGVFIVPLPVDNPLFRGLFISRKNVPIVAIYEKERMGTNPIDDICHEIGHAALMGQSLQEDTEERLCDSFGQEFSKIIKTRKIELGKFDFVDRMSMKAYREGAITASRAAEMLETSLTDFLERSKH